MTAPIGPGDFVECCPPSGFRGEVPREEVRTKGAYPCIGGVYQVRDLGRYRTRAGRLEDGLRLVGIVASVPGHPDAFWAARAFKPIYRPDATLIARLLSDIPADAPASPEEVVA